MHANKTVSVSGFRIKNLSKFVTYFYANLSSPINFRNSWFKISLAKQVAANELLEE